MYDGIPLATPTERLAPRPDTPPIPTHTPNIFLYGSIEEDEPVVSKTLITDSVLPYHPLTSVPSPHDPVTQEARQEGGAKADSKGGPTGASVFCDSFANIQARLDAILDSDDDVIDSQVVSLDDGTGSQ